MKMRATLILRAPLDRVRFAVGIVDGSRGHEESEQAPAIDWCAGCARVAANLPRIRQRHHLLRVPRLTLPGGLPPVPGPTRRIALVAVTVATIAVVGHYLSAPGMEQTSVLYASPPHSDDSAGKDRILTPIETLTDTINRALADGQLTEQEAATLGRQWPELALAQQSFESVIQGTSMQELFAALLGVTRLQKHLAAADDGTPEQIGLLLTSCNALASVLQDAIPDEGGSTDGSGVAVDGDGYVLYYVPANGATDSAPDNSDGGGNGDNGGNGNGNGGNGNGDNGNGER